MSTYRNIIKMLLVDAGSDPQAIQEIAEIAKEEVQAQLKKLGLIPAGSVVPQMTAIQPEVRVQQVMQALAQPVIQQLPPYEGIGKVFVDAMNNGGGTTKMKYLSGGEWSFQGLLKLWIHDSLTITLSHQQNVPNLPGCSFAEAIANGHPIHGDLMIQTPLGTFPFAKTSGGRSGKAHSFYRAAAQEPLLIVTMNGTFVVLTSVIFQSTQRPLG